MIGRGLRSLVATWFSGFLVLLPLVVTVAVVGWLGGFVYRLLGPSTMVGRLFATLGYPFASHPALAYLMGTLVLVAAIYLLGLVAQSRLKGPLSRLGDRTVRRVPLIGPVYGLADRFVGLLHQQEEADIRAMRPVWCFFGGDGAAVLALAPSAQAIEIEGRSYFAVVIPTAPVPFGGALLYVPVEWIRPAHIGVDKLTATYVSMGISPPSPGAEA
jgi:uncharacterized membrane protein